MQKADDSDVHPFSFFYPSKHIISLSTPIFISSSILCLSPQKNLFLLNAFTHLLLILNTPELHNNFCFFFSPLIPKLLFFLLFLFPLHFLVHFFFFWFVFPRKKSLHFFQGCRFLITKKESMSLGLPTEAASGEKRVYKLFIIFSYNFPPEGPNIIGYKKWAAHTHTHLYRVSLFIYEKTPLLRISKKMCLLRYIVHSFCFFLRKKSSHFPLHRDHLPPPPFQVS